MEEALNGVGELVRVSQLETILLRILEHICVIVLQYPVARSEPARRAIAAKTSMHQERVKGTNRDVLSQTDI
jgi:hypothetical protein